MRRLLVLTSFAGSLFACASILGDFDVDPSLNADASTPTDGSSSSSGNVADGSSSSGGTTDSGPGDYEQPIALQVATSNSATCATVQYPTSKKTVTYCWGAQGAKYPASTLGAVQGDPNVDGFYRPRVAAADIRYLTFSKLFGSGTGEWFVGSGSDTQSTATYAWGQNDFGECAAGAVNQTLPNALKISGALLQFDWIFAAPNHGCMFQNGNFFCWGRDDNCELRSGDQATCNLPAPADKIVRTVENENGNKSTSAGVPTIGTGGLDHTCLAVRTVSSGGGGDTEEVVCWGSNISGQVSTNGPSFINAPTSVGVQTKHATEELAAGENHTCAITDLTKVVCWGKNDSGQSNPQNAGAKAKPTEISGIQGGLSNLRAAGDLSCVVGKPLVGPSRAWCWGAGPRGRASGDEALPVAKVANIQDVTQLAIGRAHACAVAKKEGATATDPAQVWCWGFNDFKRVDPRSAVTQQFPQPVAIKFPPEPQ